MCCFPERETGGKMETISLFVNIYIVIQTVTSAVMCVYGYKWSKGLIAVMASYVGVGIGIFICAFLMSNGVGPAAIILVPICGGVFSKLAYDIITLNHFLAGFLLAIKVGFMIFMKMFEYSIIDDFSYVFIFPVIIGIFVGIQSCRCFSKYILIACVAFIGATEFVPRLFELINGTLFFATGDISFIFDPISFLLSLVGITIPSGGEVFFMLVIGGISFYYQKSYVDKNNIDLSDKAIDDRHLND